METVYSGASRLNRCSDVMDDELLGAYIFCHFNWDLPFLRPTMKTICAEYRRAHGQDMAHDNQDAGEGSGEEESEPEEEVVDVSA